MKRYKSLQEKKDPRRELNFEKNFIGKDFYSVERKLAFYDLIEINPVIDKNNKIVSFINGFDSDGYFMGNKIEDLGMFKSKNGYWVYFL